MSDGGYNESENNKSLEEEKKNQEQSSHKDNQEENKDNEEIKEDNKEEENEENKDNEEKKEEPAEEPFSYLENAHNENFKDREENELFDTYKGNFKYTICVLMENNNPSDSFLLKETLKSIGNNLTKLNEDINISAQEIGIFIFINEIKKSNNVLNIDNFENETEEKKNDFIIREWLVNVEKLEAKDLANIKIFSINELKYLQTIKSLKLYYNILGQIKIKKRLLFSSIMTAGITFNENKLVELISLSYHERNNNGIAVSSIDYKDNNLVSKLCTYDKKRFNVYNMNYLHQSYSVPISSQLSTFTLKDNLLNVLILYYAQYNNNFKATLDYHDYNLALYLKQNNVMIKFINDNPGYIITLPNFSFYDYLQIYIDRFSGYYGNFFQVLSSFKNCKILQVLFLIFQIISIGFEFILPSYTAMIIDIIYYVAFKIDDHRVALFLTILYICLMFAGGYCSMVGKNINKMKNTYFVINILMALFYLFSLVCSIPAMHFAHKDKHPDFSGYKFNKAAISTIIILTFIPYIIPIIINFSSMGGDAILLLVYNLVCAPLIKINFTVAGVLGAGGVSGGKMLKERKSMYSLLYLSFNLFVGSLSFYNFDNKKKANCVMAFGIIYLVYNFIRTLAVVIEICFNKEESFSNKSLLGKIKSELNKDEVEDENGNENNDENENGNDNNDENENGNDNNINNEKKDEDGREVSVDHEYED